MIFPETNTISPSPLLRKLLLTAAVLCSLATIVSCKSDPEPQGPDPAVSDLVVSAGIADWVSVESLSGSDGNDSYVFRPAWKKGDRITGFYSDGAAEKSVVYVVDSLAKDGTAFFKKSGTFTEPKDGKKVCFIFTQGIQASPVENGKVKVDIRNQSQDAPPLLMTAAGVVSDNRLELVFACRMAMFAIRNPSLAGFQSEAISLLTVSGSGVRTKGVVEVATGSIQPEGEPSDLQVSCSQQPGGSETILLAIFPDAATDLDISVRSGGKDYSLAQASFTPRANGYYRFESPDFTRPSGFVSIDWENDVASVAYDRTTGDVQIVFKGNPPILRKNDVLLVPDESGDYHIRIVSSVSQTGDGNGLLVKTTVGKMGHLFKNQRFTLSTESGVSTRSGMTAVYTPSKVEIFDGQKYIDTRGLKTRAEEMSKEIFSWEKNLDGTVLLEKGPLTVSWDKCNFDLGLKGTFVFDFGEVPWEDAGMGDLQYLSVSLEGGFNVDLALKIAAAAEGEAGTDFTLMEDIVKARYTFMVGAVPVYVSVSSDLMAEVNASAEGEVTVSGGANAGMTAKIGAEWSKEDGGKPITGIEKNLELRGPSIDAHAHLEGSVSTYPSIKIGLYSVLCPTLNPKAYVKAAADARLTEGGYWGWNAGISTGMELDLALNLDLFFWAPPLVEFDPINLFDLPVVSLPNQLSLTTETPSEMMVGNVKTIEYHATNKNHLIGKEYNGAKLLVHFEAEGGELDKEYAYTDTEGKVSVAFTLASEKEGNVKAEIVLGDEEADPVEATVWSADIIDFRLTATPLSQILGEEGHSSITFKLERFSSLAGVWAPMSGERLDFTPVGGSCPAFGVTSADGTAQVLFTAEEDFAGGSVTASVRIVGPPPVEWGGNVKAEILQPDSGGDDDLSEPELIEAKKLPENTMKVNDTEVDFLGEDDHIRFVSIEGSDQMFVDWCKEHPDYATVFLGIVSNLTGQVLGRELDLMSGDGAGLYMSLIFTGPDFTDILGDSSFLYMERSDMAEGKLFISQPDESGNMEMLLYYKSNEGLEIWARMRATIETME
jgi:hypothetical protein